MTKQELKITHYYSLRPTEYPIVESLVISQVGFRKRRIHELSVALTLRSLDDSDSRRLVLSFSKVRNLSLTQENAEISFSLLTIKPSTDGWEDINFKVFNEDPDVEFGFICDDFDVMISPLVT